MIFVISEVKIKNKILHHIRPDSVVNFPYSALNFPCTVANLPYTVVKSPLFVVNWPYVVLNSSYIVVNLPYNIVNCQSSHTEGCHHKTAKIRDLYSSGLDKQKFSV